MRLSERWETIVKQAAKVSAGGCVADVGTDHAFVPIRLLELHAASRAIAMDVREGPLERAREHIASCGMEGRIETRLSDGLSALKPGEAETVIIAGMGGELMLRILRESGDAFGSVRHFILSPQSETALFRHGLEKLGLSIADEVMVKDGGKYYVVMTALPGAMHYEEEYRYRYGDLLLRKKSPALKELLEREIARGEALLEELARAGTEGARSRYEAYSEELRQAKEAYYEMQ